jgi:hypothetical protein
MYNSLLQIWSRNRSFSNVTKPAITSDVMECYICTKKMLYIWNLEMHCSLCTHSG